MTSGAGTGGTPGLGAEVIVSLLPASWQDFTDPNAGSVPKNSLVHWPVPETAFLIHFEPAPYLTICVPVTENVPPSTARVCTLLADVLKALESVLASTAAASAVAPPSPPPQALRTAAKIVQ